MPLVNTVLMLRKASEEGYCVGAFNIVDHLTMEAVVRAAEARSAPVIIQTSAGTVERYTAKGLAAMARQIAGESPVPVGLHLDHGTDREMIHQAIAGGYTSVMIDASKYGFDENVARTLDVVKEAHSRGLSVEGEIGVGAGVEEDIGVRQDKAIYTTPEEALRFQAACGVDFLAAAIGTAHGFYKVEPRLDIETLRSIRSGADFPLVVHGATGLPMDTVQALVAAGAAKMNVSTQIKQTYIDALYKYIGEHREEYNPMRVLKYAFKQLVDMLGNYIAVLGSQGKA